ncbi:MAG TPA: malate/lactate/ureidoglycolate dehydrogenase [Geminicoccaceae bacterium]|nr:malate/lactate/ureidoglycolate dehydrogenase [Geminicoccus sp.]HMU51281.1 malate/lactate/ureidoglycolate dehydrogenase [Geminicoccaceae bacterium]
MRQIKADRLRELALLIVRATGSDDAEAAAVADHLVRSNLCGHDSHGIGMLPDYVRMASAGLLVPNQTLRTVSDSGAVLVFDAGRGYGQTMAAEAMRRGIARAGELGAAVVALRNSSHIGRIGYWAEQCAAAGMASVHFVNVADHSPYQAPFACSDARLGTNPFCAALPGSDGPSVLLDMATSAIAFGKARVARNKGVPVPEGTLIDAAGRPTTDPTDYVDGKGGALVSFGLHKGSGLAVLCEVLGAALTGGMTIQPGHPRQGGIVNSMLSIIIDPGAMGSEEAIAAEVEAVKGWIKASPPAPGFDAVLLPGEPERLSFVQRTADGIPLDERSLSDIVAAGVALGLDRGLLAPLAGLEG